MMNIIQICSSLKLFGLRLIWKLKVKPANLKSITATGFTSRHYNGKQTIRSTSASQAAILRRLLKLTPKKKKFPTLSLR
jgi:hypothetical protein